MGAAESLASGRTSPLDTPATASEKGRRRDGESNSIIPVFARLFTLEVRDQFLGQHTFSTVQSQQQQTLLEGKLTTGLSAFRMTS